VLASDGDGKPQAVVMLTPDLLPRLKAADVLNRGMSHAGFKGGGQPGVAQGGGAAGASVDRALAEARQLVKETLSG